VDIGRANCELLVSSTDALPKPLLLTGNHVLSLWGFTCDASGTITCDLHGHGPYVHAMERVHLAMKATDQLRLLYYKGANNPFHWWPGSQAVCDNTNFEALQRMITCAHRLHLEYREDPAKVKIPGISNHIETVLELREVANNDLILLVLAIQKNAKGKRDVHPFRNPMGVNNLSQQNNLMSPTFMAFFLMVTM